MNQNEIEFTVKKYPVGYSVWLAITPRTVNNSACNDSKKLMPRWSGPFVVLKQLPPILLRLQHRTKRRPLDVLVNIRCVKPYRGPTTILL